MKRGSRCWVSKRGREEERFGPTNVWPAPDVEQKCVIPELGKALLPREAFDLPSKRRLRFGPPTAPTRTSRRCSGILQSQIVKCEATEGPFFVIELHQSCGEEVQISCINYAHYACGVGASNRDILFLLAILSNQIQAVLQKRNCTHDARSRTPARCGLLPNQ